jgi:hypothetical protein
VRFLFFKLRQAFFAVLGQNDFVALLRKFLLVQAKKAQIIVYTKDLFHGDLLSGKREMWRDFDTAHFIIIPPAGEIKIIGFPCANAPFAGGRGYPKT